MEISKRYNSFRVKDNCALFAPPPIFGSELSDGVVKIFSFADPCCHDNEFWNKIDYNSAPVKDNCALFAPTLIRSC